MNAPPFGLELNPHQPKAVILTQTKNMKTKLLASLVAFFFFLLPNLLDAQVPVANFSVSANPACTNNNNSVIVTDLSTNSPTAWSYTIAIAGPGPGGVSVSSNQNPTITFNFQGTYTITLVATNANGSSTPVSQTVQVLGSPNVNITPGNINSCIGGSPLTITLTPNGNGSASYTYSWSTGATTASISVTPSVSTQYSCVITATNGCKTVRTSSVTIGQPTVNISSFPVNLCPGSNATLTGQISGNGPNTYSWSTGATTNTISVSNAGVYSVTITNGLGCSNTRSFTLSTASSLSLTAGATPTAICSGGQANIHVTGAASYTWSNGATNANVNVAPQTTTTYTVIGLFGTCTGTATVFLQVNATPTITVLSSTNAVCAGNSVSLTASGANSYTWNPGAIVSPSINVTPGSITTYTVRGQNPGCPPRNASITINVMPNPTVSVNSSSAIVCVGETVSLNVSGAFSYSWNNGGQSANITITPSVTTTYTVVGTSLNGCFSSATIVQQTSDCTGINELSLNNWGIWPNPNTGSFNVSSNNRLEISLITQQGQTLTTIVLDETNGYQLSFTGLSEGLYLITAKSGNTLLKRKMLVAR